MGVCVAGVLTAACGDDGEENPAGGGGTGGGASGGACGATIATNHGHKLTVTKAEAMAGVAKTYDIAHGSTASLESPLTPRDAARANSDNAELTIVGVPANSELGRRVNVGMVNIGLIPATFRVTVRTRSGAQIGRAIESGVPEDEVWLVRDLELQTGVKIDESATIRITAIAGTGVGFATVVEPNGDNHVIPAVPSQQQ